ncbi:MAG: preprotein translocase subunit YajC [Deltaproteobacteria bacterium]
MFVTPAFAQAAGSVPGAGAAFANIVPLIAIFGIMYFLLIRPQQKKMKAQAAMISAVRRGDQVVTGGGIIGKVTKVGEAGEIEVEIATGVKVRVMKATLTNVLTKGEPAKAE